MNQPHLVLAGLGHAHLFVLEALAQGRLRGVRATLVTPATYHYSGMIPGTVAGCYDPAASRFDPARLAHAAGATWIDGTITRIDPAATTVHVSDGRTLRYDRLALDVGSQQAADDLPGVRDHALTVKPVANVLRLHRLASAAIEQASRSAPASIVIVGGGAAGVEIALCLSAWLQRRFDRGRYRLTIVATNATILPEYAPRLRSLALRLLWRRAITLRLRTTVSRVEPDRIVASDGPSLRFDVLLWASGPRANDLLRHGTLPTDDHGYLCATPTLQVRDHPTIFAAGDAIHLAGYDSLPKAGVYAVRQGPVLARNLAASLNGGALAAYTPQRDWLSLLNCGDGHALLSYKRLALHSRWAWWLKDAIDRRFMRRFGR
jgi:pyridine nucleotide-disulfide oxidoreductase family protein